MENENLHLRKVQQLHTRITRKKIPKYSQVLSNSSQVALIVCSSYAHRTLIVPFISVTLKFFFSVVISGSLKYCL
jgi:hypothetical protein